MVGTLLGPAEWPPALEIAARMLGSGKSRGYCLEMICADFLAVLVLTRTTPRYYSLPCTVTFVFSLRRINVDFWSPVMPSSQSARGFSLMPPSTSGCVVRCSSAIIVSCVVILRIFTSTT